MSFKLAIKASGNALKIANHLVTAVRHTLNGVVLVVNGVEYFFENSSEFLLEYAEKLKPDTIPLEEEWFDLETEENVEINDE